MTAWQSHACICSDDVLILEDASGSGPKILSAELDIWPYFVHVVVDQKCISLPEAYSSTHANSNF